MKPPAMRVVLHWWSWALRKRQAQPSARAASGELVSAFLPVRVVERDVVAGEATHLPGCPVEIVVDDRHAVRVGPGFDEATLRRVLDVLRAVEVA